MVRSVTGFRLRVSERDEVRLGKVLKTVKGQSLESRLGLFSLG